MTGPKRGEEPLRSNREVFDEARQEIARMELLTGDRSVQISAPWPANSRNVVCVVATARRVAR